MNRYEQEKANDLKRIAVALGKINKVINTSNKRQRMTEELRDRINQFNEIKYGSDDNETRIVFVTLKPIETVTKAYKVL